MSEWVGVWGSIEGGLTSLFFFPKRKMNTAVLEYPIGGMLLNYIFIFIRLILKIHLSAQYMFVIVVFMVSFFSCRSLSLSACGSSLILILLFQLIRSRL